MSPTGIDSISIGSQKRAGNGAYFEGLIRDVRLYDRAVPDAVIAAMYDPATRWNLYAPIRRWWAVAAPAGEPPATSMAAHYYRHLLAGAD